MRIWKVEVSNVNGLWTTYLGLAATAQAAITEAITLAACEAAPKDTLYASSVSDIGDVQFGLPK